jgi:hypothetical protein
MVMVDAMIFLMPTIYILYKIDLLQMAIYYTKILLILAVLEVGQSGLGFSNFRRFILAAVLSPYQSL